MSNKITEIEVNGTSYIVGGLTTVAGSNGALVHRDMQSSGNTIGTGAINLQKYYDGATGNYSVVAGYDNTASGNYAVACGIENLATGNNSTAFGSNNTASADGGMAQGVCCNNPFHSTATNYDYLASQGSYPTNNPIMHSGKISVTLVRNGTSVTQNIMDFTGLQFTGILVHQAIFITDADVIYTARGSTYIYNNTIRGTGAKISLTDAGCYYGNNRLGLVSDGTWLEKDTTAEDASSQFTLPLENVTQYQQVPYYIESNILKHKAFTEQMKYAQIGIDYTCIALRNSNT